LPPPCLKNGSTYLKARASGGVGCQFPFSEPERQLQKSDASGLSFQPT
jgi:hypothetical protein